MAVSALLVCREDDSIRVIRRVLDEMGIASDVCDDPRQALSAVGQQKYDAVMVDCDDLPGGGSLMRDVRRGTSNRLAIVFALTNGTTVRSAFDLGANFVLEKPISQDRATRCLRAAHGLMMRERRRYLRQPVNVAAILTLKDGMEVRGVIVDVSEGGVAMRGLDPSLEGHTVRLNFELPRASRHFDVRALVSWTGPDGRAGLRFSLISETARTELMRWLSEENESAEPPAAFSGTAKVMRVGE
jgi:DNA-binding response OmpR family regulator